MSKVKRGRPSIYDAEDKEAVQKASRKASKKKNAHKYKNITVGNQAVKMLWDCVIVMSAKIGVKLSISQVMVLLLNDWLKVNDPTEELRKDERYINDKVRGKI